jgi:hypothetical protein
MHPCPDKNGVDGLINSVFGGLPVVLGLAAAAPALA